MLLFEPGRVALVIITMKVMKKMKKKNFMPFMYFMVKNNQLKSNSDN